MVNLMLLEIIRENDDLRDLARKCNIDITDIATAFTSAGSRNFMKVVREMIEIERVFNEERRAKHEANLLQNKITKFEFDKLAELQNLA